MHIRKYSLRFVSVFLFFIACLVGFQAKLILIQFFKSAHLARLAERQHEHFIKLEPRRGGIYDRKLRPLALNVPVYSLYAQPKSMSRDAKEQAVARLPVLLAMDPSTIRSLLEKDKYFVWIARKLPAEQVEKIRSLQIQGLDFRKESKRYYPNQMLAAHVIGFAGIDNQGLEGIELALNRYLEGESGWWQNMRDARMRELLIDEVFIPAQDGFDIVLTIDETIQYIAERALDKAFKKHHAIGASIIVMDPRTGEILALANRPSFDLHAFASSTPDSRRNRAVSDMYEPGSVFKIITASAALEEDAMQETDTFFCENGEYRVANHILHDHRPHGTLTFSEVFEQSSNIGVTKIAQRLGPAVIYRYAQLFRFGKPTGVDLPGEVGGVLKHPKYWSKTSIGAIPIGHEVAVTALQLVCAMATIANDGIYMRPFVVKYVKDQHGELIEEFGPLAVSHVITSETAERVTSILERVVEQGTGRLAGIKGVRVAGKTGTSQKVVDGIYSHSKFYASFIGFAPIDNPRVAIVVIFDEPHPNHFGGTVSAPVFKEVAQDVLKYLNSQ